MSARLIDGGVVVVGAVGGAAAGGLRWLASRVDEEPSQTIVVEVSEKEEAPPPGD